MIRIRLQTCLLCICLIAIAMWAVTQAQKSSRREAARLAETQARLAEAAKCSLAETAWKTALEIRARLQQARQASVQAPGGR